MAFNWDGYIDFAKELKNDTNEAKLRSSISRGYYGVYHKSRIKLGHTSGTYIPHKQLIENLRNSPEINDNNRLANQLDILKQDRVNADYMSFEPITPQYVSMFWVRLERYVSSLTSEDD